MKIVTLCGSLKFKNEMMTVAEKMALEGYCILTPVYPVSDKMKRTKELLIKLKEAHFKRIKLSDAILVVDINNYIGRNKINAVNTQSNVKIEVISRDTFAEYEVYNIRVTNNSDKTIYLERSKWRNYI